MLRTCNLRGSRLHDRAWPAVALTVAALWLGAASLEGSLSPAPPDDGQSPIDVPPTTSVDLVRQMQLGELTARFEKTGLGEIASALGREGWGRSGSDGSSMNWFCYRMPGQLLWLVATPMSSGRLHFVVAERVRGNDPRTQRCPPIAESHRPVSLEFGWIGTSERELHEKLGAPSGTRGAWQLFHYEGTVEAPAPGLEAPHIVNWEVLAYIEAKVEAGAVTALRAYHGTSY